jgi:methyl-accepting chemotaxis protein
MAILVVIVIAVSLANLLSRGMTVPILELRDTANRASRGDTSQPVSVNTDDEIGDLARDFERMRKSLEAAMRRLKRAA